MSTVGRSLKASLGDSRLLLPLAVLGLIFLFDLIFIPGFFDTEIEAGPSLRQPRRHPAQ